MKVLIVGSGGREHALAWKCAQSDDVDDVLVAPGNAGTALEPGVRNVDVGAEDIDALLDLARAENADLTIVGPEVPLVDGIVDRFRDAGLACFGPDAAGARLEGSKAYTKEFLARHGIPTAAYRNFEELEPALAYVREQGAPIVVKADGLAAGKGVIVARTLDEAEAADHRHAEWQQLRRRRPSCRGRGVPRRRGSQLYRRSRTARTSLPLASSQDHKAQSMKGTSVPTPGAWAPTRRRRSLPRTSSSASSTK